MCSCSFSPAAQSPPSSPAFGFLDPLLALTKGAGLHNLGNIFGESVVVRGRPSAAATGGGGGTTGTAAAAVTTNTATSAQIFQRLPKVGIETEKKGQKAEEVATTAVIMRASNNYSRNSII